MKFDTYTFLTKNPTYTHTKHTVTFTENRREGGREGEGAGERERERERECSGVLYHIVPW